jgi:hypothetical protein
MSEDRAELAEIAADYKKLAEGANGQLDPVRQKYYDHLVRLADREKILKEMPLASQFAKLEVFSAKWDQWFEVFNRMI